MDRESDIPLYSRISLDIISKIAGGELRPGMQLPSENEIIQKYSVSNTTARKVLNEMESKGLATRIKGKGTFVLDRRVERSASRILGFTRNMIEAGFTPSTRLLAASVVEKGHSAQIGQRRYKMADPVFKIHRLRFADDIPMLLEVRYISMELCPSIENQNFDGSLYEIYDKLCKFKMTEIIQDLKAIMMDTGIREFFNLRAPTPAFLIEGVTFCGPAMILEMEKSIYRGDRYGFTVRAT